MVSPRAMRPGINTPAASASAARCREENQEEKGLELFIRTTPEHGSEYAIRQTGAGRRARDSPLGATIDTVSNVRCFLPSQLLLWLKPGRWAGVHSSDDAMCPCHATPSTMRLPVRCEV